MLYSNAEWESKLDHTLRSRYSVWLMNNTKWREVWSIVCENHLRVQMDYANEPNWGGVKTLWGPFSPDYIEDRGIRDPGIGGPFLFKQILWLRIPRIFGNDLEVFLTETKTLGVLPITKNDEYVEVQGYANPSQPS